MTTLKLFLIAAAVSCAPLFAQPACTTITGPVYQLGATTATVLLLDRSTLDLNLGCTPPSGPSESSVRISTASCTFSTCLPPATYSVTYSVRRPAPLAGITTYPRIWTVPGGVQHGTASRDFDARYSPDAG